VNSLLGTARAASRFVIKRERLVIASGIGLLTFGLAIVVQGAQGNVGDFAQQHAAGRAVLSGRDPYVVAPQSWPWPYAYPFPSALVVSLVAGLPQAIAFAAFMSAALALLVYGLLRAGWYRLPALASGATVAALSLGQWSPLLTASLLVAPLAPLWVVKPNIGLALVAASPTRWRILGGVVVLAGSVALFPTWPTSWLAALSALGHVRSPVFLPGGLLLLLAATRWRRPEARLLLALSLVPQTLSIADTLPLLCLVPDTLRQALTLALLSQLAGVASRLLILDAFDGRAPTPHELLATDSRVTGPLLVALTYLPCLLLVLRRRNEVTPPLDSTRE